MKISLGQHETANGGAVDAWIEPNRPAYRGGAVRDNGFLCVAVQDGPQMRLESTSEDSWKLTDAVGIELGRKLWEERRRYDREPYYMAYDHAQYGRLYFTPWAVEGSEPSIAFHTRPDGRYPKEGAVIPDDKAPEQLRALFAHENLSRHGGLIPDTHQIAEAIEQSQRVVDAVIAARAEYSAVVDWDFDKRLNAVMMAATGRKPLTDENDIERYEALSSWAQRPDLHSFTTDEPEFYRWFEHGGKARLEPLTAEQLTTYLRDERGYPAEQAERTGQMESVSREDWDWFKDKRLGLLREPVQVLHDLIRHEEAQPNPNREWLDKAFKAGDFCATLPVGPAKVLDAIQEFTAASQRDYVLAHQRDDHEATQRELVALANDPVYRKAVAAASLLQDPRNGLAIEAAHPVNRALAVYADLHENNLARIAALSAGDKDAAARHVEDGDELLGQYHRAEAVIGFAEPEEPQAQEPAAERDDDYDFAP